MTTGKNSMTRTLGLTMSKAVVCAFFSFFILTSTLFAQSKNSDTEIESMTGEPPVGINMREMMRGPKVTELYPTMVSSSQPSQDERQSMELHAERWIAEGKEMLKEGAIALSKATSQSDIVAMGKASLDLSSI